jgi:hypothetical protein
MLAEAEYIEPDPVGELNLLEEPPQAVARADDLTAARIRRRLAEAIDPELDRRRHA